MEFVFTVTMKTKISADSAEQAEQELRKVIGPKDKAVAELSGVSENGQAYLSVVNDHTLEPIWYRPSCQKCDGSCIMDCTRSKAERYDGPESIYPGWEGPCPDYDPEDLTGCCRNWDDGDC